MKVALLEWSLLGLVVEVNLQVLLVVEVNLLHPVLVMTSLH